MDADLGVETANFQPMQVHAGTNMGSSPVDAIVIEFKGGKPGAGKMPATRDNMTMKVLAENARASAVRATAAPAFVEPAGSTHDFDQIVIALGTGQMSLSIDGKPAKSNWTRGDVAFIPRGTPHESKNAGGKPVDFIIVAIK
jgi:mannose-6-phosphate isomerase-like protein (cupin superfamily)